MDLSLELIGSFDLWVLSNQLSCMIFWFLFRWGTHLYMSLFLSVCLSVCPFVAQHIPGTVHHLKFLVHTCKMMIFAGFFFSFFQNFDFLGCYGSKRAKNGPKWKNNYIRHAPYLRNRTSSEYNLWYTHVKCWYLQVFFFIFFKILVFWAVRGVKWQKIAQNEK